MTAIGCGGGAGSQVTQDGNTSVIGQASFVFQGSPKPAVQSALGAVSVVGIAGANYSSMLFTPNQDLNNTAIAFKLGQNIWTYYNGTATQITTGIANADHPAFSPYGLIVFSVRDRSGCGQVWRCTYDGNGLTQITADETQHLHPSYSPDGTKIVYDDGTYIYTIPSGGGTPTLIGPGTQPAYTYNGTYILYVTNTTPTRVATYPSFYDFGSSDNEEFPSSAAKLFTITYMASPPQIWVYDDVSNTVLEAYAPSTSFSMSQSTISPDGKQMAFIGANGSAAPSLYLSTSEGLNATAVMNSQSTSEAIAEPTWSPYFQPRKFVGTSGLMFTTASGFLWGSVGNGFGSWVSFQAQTPSTATITPQGSANTTSLVFLIQADVITNLKYTNCYYGSVSTPISASTSVTQALVSINSVSGTVEATVPFLQMPSGKTVKSSTSGANLVYSGTIPAIYNAKGQNIAPAGAHQVTVNPKTGKLVSWN
jgi:hypothetical protein